MQVDDKNRRVNICFLVFFTAEKLFLGDFSAFLFIFGLRPPALLCLHFIKHSLLSRFPFKGIRSLRRKKELPFGKIELP